MNNIMLYNAIHEVNDIITTREYNNRYTSQIGT
jgi:hypothetical protein